jgi:hypothetical protein
LERPEVKEPGNPVDALAGARLKREGLGFSPEAEAHTLLRRASLSLTGLPPIPDEMATHPPPSQKNNSGSCCQPPGVDYSPPRE